MQTKFKHQNLAPFVICNLKKKKEKKKVIQWSKEKQKNGALYNLKQNEALNDKPIHFLHHAFYILDLLIRTKI
jgi:hypothetical protein